MIKDTIYEFQEFHMEESSKCIEHKMELTKWTKSKIKFYPSLRLEMLLTQFKMCMIIAIGPLFSIFGTSNPIVSEYHFSGGMHGVKFNFSSSDSLLATLPSSDFAALTDSTLVFLPMIDCWVAREVLMKREWLSRRDSRVSAALSETFFAQLK